VGTYNTAPEVLTPRPRMTSNFRACVVQVWQQKLLILKFTCEFHSEVMYSQIEHLVNVWYLNSIFSIYNLVAMNSETRPPAMAHLTPMTTKNRVTYIYKAAISLPLQISILFPGKIVPIGRM
jgi:hypothetical protein